MEPNNLLRVRYRLRFIQQMKRFYGPQWWKFYLKISRELRRAQKR